MDVDTALSEVPVNVLPLLDDTTFKDIEAAVAYNAAGMALYWHFVTSAGAYTVTAVTPTTGGDYDWTDQGDAGIYTIEIPASGGASINNDTEGFGWFTGKATGVLPWRGPIIGFRRAALNDLMIEGSTASTNLEDFFDGTGYVGGTIKLASDATLNATQGSYAPAKAGDAMTLTAAYDAAKSAAPAGAAMTLTAAYDAAKTAAQVSDITAAHSTTNGKIDAVDDYVDTEIAAIIGTLATIQGYVDDLESRLTAARAGYLDLLNTNLDAAISTRAAAATALSSATWTNTKAGYIDAAISSVGGGSLTAADIADAVLDEAAAGHTGVIATNLDAAVSTRLATTGYTAPSNSDITTIKTAIENVTYGLSALKTSLATIQGYVDDLETRLTATRAGYLDNLSTAPPTASDIDTELSSSHGAGAWGAASTGSSTYTDTVKDTNESGLPVEEVDVYLYNNSGYSGSPVAKTETDVNGVFTFHIDPGTYYVRCIKSGYTFTDFSKVVT